jgi:hypothetical protein
MRPGLEASRAAVVALVSAVATIVAAYLTWIRTHIDGLAAPGSTTSGLEGRDGRTVLVVGIVALVVAALVAAGRRDAWLRAVLLVAGGVTTIIAAVDLADASAKAERIEDEFGVPADAVRSSAGVGLWVLLAAGIGLLVAGLLAPRGDDR